MAAHCLARYTFRGNRLVRFGILAGLVLPPQLVILALFQIQQFIHRIAMPNYLISYSDHKVVLRNYEGYITTYEEPLGTKQHDRAACKSCQSARRGTMRGRRPRTPRGRADVDRATGSEVGRARQSRAAPFERPEKWTPYGVGPIEGQAREPLAVLPATGDR